MSDYGNVTFLREKIQANISGADDDCWLWGMSRDMKGYGVLWVNGNIQRTHRLAYTVFVGPIPDGMFVCHKCDVPACCNPSHLFLGTQLDNMRDAKKKGRMKGGGTQASGYARKGTKNVRTEKACAGCGKSFLAGMTSAKWCGYSCKNKDAWARKKARAV